MFSKQHSYPDTKINKLPISARHHTSSTKKLFWSTEGYKPSNKNIWGHWDRMRRKKRIWLGVGQVGSIQQNCCQDIICMNNFAGAIANLSSWACPFSSGTINQMYYHNYEYINSQKCFQTPCCKIAPENISLRDKEKWYGSGSGTFDRLQYLLHIWYIDDPT